MLLTERNRPTSPTAGPLLGSGATVDNYVARANGPSGNLIDFSSIIADDGGSHGYQDGQGVYWPDVTGAPSVSVSGSVMLLDFSGTAAGSVTVTCGSSGTVTIGPSSAAGLVAVDTGLALKAGTSSGRIAKVGGTIYASTTTANNGTTVETDLWSQSVAANVLATNHDCLRFLYSGSTAANANTKRIRVYWGVSATPIFDTTAQAVNGQDWTIEGLIIRTGAATQKVSVWLKNAAGTLWTFVNYATAAETLANALTLKITGQSGTASNDITFELGKIMWEPAP